MIIVYDDGSREEELSVEVGEVNGVHVYHMDLGEPQQSLHGGGN